MRKRIISIAGLLLTAAGVCAQTEVTAGIMYGKEYGVTYFLPQTEIELTLYTTQYVYTPGEFCKYAERYLRIPGVSPEARTYWTMDKLQTGIVGVPDKDQVYFVKLKDKTVAPLMELTEDGIVRSINMPYSGIGKEMIKTSITTETNLDPRSFLTEEILLTNSRAKMAELVAKEIYNIRESKNALLRGEADNMPQDGTQLKIMLDNLNRQEQAMTEMFTGKTVKTQRVFHLRITPQEMEQTIAGRFSEKLGLVSKDDLAGEPIYISITNLNAIAIPEESGKKKVEGIAYNVPGKAHVIVRYKQKNLFDDDLSVSQFGTQEYLAPVLFNKTNVTKVLFDTATGGLIKVDRGEQ